MFMKRRRSAGLAALSLLAALLGTTACEDDGGGSPDLGDNDPNIVVCLGDSITLGYGDNGADYPARLAQKAGKSVVNAGVGGLTSAGGVGRIQPLLSRRPGYVCILLGANDAIRSIDPVTTKENLRAIVAACKANRSYAILGTLTPEIGDHALHAAKAEAISVEIRALAKEEGVGLVDVERSFRGHPEFENADGLHMSDAGNERLAQLFNGKL